MASGWLLATFVMVGSSVAGPDAAPSCLPDGDPTNLILVLEDLQKKVPQATDDEQELRAIPAVIEALQTYRVERAAHCRDLDTYKVALAAADRMISAQGRLLAATQKNFDAAVEAYESLEALRAPDLIPPSRLRFGWLAGACFSGPPIVESSGDYKINVSAALCYGLQW